MQYDDTIKSSPDATVVYNEVIKSGFRPILSIMRLFRQAPTKHIVDATDVTTSGKQNRKNIQEIKMKMLPATCCLT